MQVCIFWLNRIGFSRLISQGDRMAMARHAQGAMDEMAVVNRELLDLVESSGSKAPTITALVVGVPVVTDVV